MAATTIVSPETLRERLDDPQWIVVDCRFNLQDIAAGRRAYEAGHIPGAFFADLEHDLAGEKTGTNGRHPLPDPERFAESLRSLGARDETQLVAYDEGADMYAARLWFLCRWIGHDAVAVLDGGIAGWRALGLPISTQAPRTRARGTLRVVLRPELIVDTRAVFANLREPGMHVLDARAAERFRGDVEPLDRVAGHIPGARNRWFKANFDERGRFKTPKRLRDEFAPYGPPHEIVHQCGSGVSSAVNALAMELAGLHDWRLYPGSWSEWSSDPERPIETGDER
ncbi:MAG TPA: sulfurtransferase [Candidatus Dormibacteraeota bacterium]|nr:sulfurtransferase [Candidatus Dormibacteraeota bacterium]